MIRFVSDLFAFVDANEHFALLCAFFMAGLALNYILQNNFKEDVGMRPSARKIGVLITDGKSQDDVIANSQNLRNQGVELYAIGKQRLVQLTCAFPASKKLLLTLDPYVIVI